MNPVSFTTVVSEPSFPQPVEKIDAIRSGESLKKWVVTDSVISGAVSATVAGREYCRPDRRPPEQRAERRKQLEWEIEKLLQKQLVLSRELKRKYEEYRVKKWLEEASLQAELMAMFNQLEAWRKGEDEIRDELKIENLLLERLSAEQQEAAQHYIAIDEYITEQLAALEKVDKEQHNFDPRKRSELRKGEQNSQHVQNLFVTKPFSHGYKKLLNGLSNLFEEEEVPKTLAMSKIHSVGMALVLGYIGSFGTQSMITRMQRLLGNMEVKSTRLEFCCFSLTKQVSIINIWPTGIGTCTLNFGLRISMEIVEVKLVGELLSNLRIAYFGAESYKLVGDVFLANEYKLLGQSSCISVTVVDYAEQFHMGVGGLNIVHLNKKDQAGVIAIIAVIQCLEYTSLDIINKNNHREVYAHAYPLVISWNGTRGNEFKTCSHMIKHQGAGPDEIIKEKGVTSEGASKIPDLVRSNVFVEEWVFNGLLMYDEVLKLMMVMKKQHRQMVRSLWVLVCSFPSIQPTCRVEVNSETSSCHEVFLEFLSARSLLASKEGFSKASREHKVNLTIHMMVMYETTNKSLTSLNEDGVQISDAKIYAGTFGIEFLFALVVVRRLKEKQVVELNWDGISGFWKNLF